MKAVGIILGVVALVSLLVVLVTAVWTYSWNLAIAPTFSVGEIDFWQGLFMLFALTIVGGMFKTNVDMKKQ